jgi:hypothetical protein
MMALIAAAVTVTSCNGSPTGPTPVSEALRLSVSLSQPVIPARGSATMTIRLENTSPDNLTLRFPSSCQIRSYIVDLASNAVVFPWEGEWACVTDVTELQLPPYSTATRQVELLQAIQCMPLPGPSYFGLAAGEYSAYAVVEDAGRQLKSAPVRFTVQGT